jgi:hypothetical protein
VTTSACDWDRYLRAMGKLTPEMDAKLLHNMRAGYERLLTFRDIATGGFSLWPGGSGHEAFYTALAAGTIGAMKDYITIDHHILTMSRKYLQQHNHDGAFKYVCVE